MFPKTSLQDKKKVMSTENRQDDTVPETLDFGTCSHLVNNTFK
jgi:hypothetical protein